MYRGQKYKDNQNNKKNNGINSKKIKKLNILNNQSNKNNNNVNIINKNIRNNQIINNKRNYQNNKGIDNNKRQNNQNIKNYRKDQNNIKKYQNCMNKRIINASNQKDIFTRRNINNILRLFHGGKFDLIYGIKNADSRTRNRKIVVRKNNYITIENEIKQDPNKLNSIIKLQKIIRSYLYLRELCAMKIQAVWRGRNTRKIMNLFNDLDEFIYHLAKVQFNKFYDNFTFFINQLFNIYKASIDNGIYDDDTDNSNLNNEYEETESDKENCMNQLTLEKMDSMNYQNNQSKDNKRNYQNNQNIYKNNLNYRNSKNIINDNFKNQNINSENNINNKNSNNTNINNYQKNHLNIYNMNNLKVNNFHISFEGKDELNFYKKNKQLNKLLDKYENLINHLKDELCKEKNKNEKLEKEINNLHIQLEGLNKKLKVNENYMLKLSEKN